MAVKNAMFLFEIALQSVNYMSESRIMIIKGDFADIFSLELKDPKKMNIIIPDPLPLPPAPVGKKGKKKKPKPKKPKKGKKGAVVVSAPEPEILCGQSVLFGSSAEVIYKTMEQWPLVLSLWSKEDNLVFIGASRIPWDPMFLQFLQKIVDCQEPPPVALKEEYNVFEEGTPKIMAKVTLFMKLSYLSTKLTTSFRTLSEDPTAKKFLYTGLNSKTTSYICTMKTTEEAYVENSNKIPNNYAVDIDPKMVKPIAYADYKNAPCNNVSFFNEGDLCCMGHVDKHPDSKYKAPDTCPSIEFIIDYVRKIIVSCNDNMRMLTPRPTIKPRVKATDIDRLCYCRETLWPEGKLAERFKRDVQSGPCPMCTEAGKKDTKSRGKTFDIANIRGPCGSADCRIAKEMRSYIENLVDEDNIEIEINEIFGPCGSKKCTIAEKIQEFVRHEGIFTEGQTVEGLSTKCACTQKMQHALTVKKESCSSVCSKECFDAGSEDSICDGEKCPFKKPTYNVFYFTVEYDFEKNPTPTSSKPSSVGKASTTVSSKSSKTSSTDWSKYQYCAPDCPTAKSSEEKITCSKTTCSISAMKPVAHATKCEKPVCPKAEIPPSPADSNIEIEFDEIRNPCCVKSCDIAEKIKDLIVDGAAHKNVDPDHCFCDCVCDLHFSRKTTYCNVCGGFECLGDDMKDQPEFMKPHPCPVYHKLYDKRYIKVQSPFSDEMPVMNAKDSSSKETKTSVKIRGSMNDKKQSSRYSSKLIPEKKAKKKVEKSKVNVEQIKAKKAKKKVGKFTANATEASQGAVVEKKPAPKYPYPPVPKHMGWNWTADDIPGMKPRPQWKPGAAHKILVRRYRALRGEGVDIALKKKRALMQRKKKIEMKPTLVITKQKYGEYRVHMEVFKKYSKERLPFQYPYDEKPPLVYTIGKTEEEKYKLKKQQDRKDRRETRRKRRYLQSTFRDKCQEICLKAYNQALGVLPLPNPNSPDCPCHTEKDPRLTPPIDSCSCSDEGTLSSSDTDGDEWVIEFTPPIARWDPKAKHPPVLVEDESQYNYLDYKVKLLDRSGNAVPRYFKGPDGKQECSDLGGFWGPGKIWLEINKDGFIGPDNRWVPLNFTGPDGFTYSSEEGGFTDSSGQFLKIGIDGYIDIDNKWVWYGRGKKAKSLKGSGHTPSDPLGVSPVERAKVLSKTNAVPGVRYETSPKAKGDGAGSLPSHAKPDSKKTHLPPSASPAPKVLEKHKNTIASKKDRQAIVMNVSLNYRKNRMNRFPPSKGSHCVDPKTLAKYNEIMNGLQPYKDLQFRPIVKTNRACNTGRKEPLRKRTYFRTNANYLRNISTPSFSDVQ